MVDDVLAMIDEQGYGNDESVQFASKFPNACLGVGADRAREARICLSRPGGADVSVAILDDGLQHWAMRRDVDIVMFNALNPWGNGGLIPAGILREPLAALARAHVVVVNHAALVPPARLEVIRRRLRALCRPEALVVDSRMAVTGLVRASAVLSHIGAGGAYGDLPAAAIMDPAWAAGQDAYLVSGVGNPQPLEALVRQSLRPASLRACRFEDHHQYTAADVGAMQAELKGLTADLLGGAVAARGGGGGRAAGAAKEPVVVLTTEKDFFRSGRALLPLDPVVLLAELQIADGGEREALLALLGRRAAAAARP